MATRPPKSDDTTKSPAIEIDEASLALRSSISSVNVVMAQSVKATMQAMDSNGDGQIDMTEYLAGGGGRVQSSGR